MVDGMLQIRRIGASAGAEVTGVDLSGNLTNDQSAVIHQALLDHLVLCFPGQELSPEDQIAFARRWGDLAIHPNLTGMDDFPEIIAVERKPGDSGHLGSEWHNDTTSLEKPPMGTMMYSKIVPPVGGDTLFANQYDAYDALSNGMKDMLDGLRAVHGDGRVAGPRAADYATRLIALALAGCWIGVALRHRERVARDPMPLFLASLVLMLLLPSLMWDHYAVQLLPVIFWLFGRRATLGSPWRALDIARAAAPSGAAAFRTVRREQWSTFLCKS